MRFHEWDAKKELRQSNRARYRTRNFAQILQKKLRVQMDNKCRIFRIILVSIIFLPILLIIRNLGQAKVVPKQIYDHFPIDNLDKMRLDLDRIRNTSDFKFVEKIAFTPNGHALEMIIAMTVEKLKLKGYVGVQNVSELERIVQKENLMAGVRFILRKTEFKKLPSKLDFELRFPPTLRTVPRENERFWPTNKLYPGLITLVTGKPDDRKTKTSTYGYVPPGYVQEGFIALQHAISMAYIELVSGLSVSDLPNIYMSRFPRQRYIYDRLFVVIKLLLPIGVMFSYAYSSYKMILYITNETELRIMKSLKVRWLNWCAWFFVLFLLQFFIILLSLFILSSCGWDQNILEYSNPVCILWFMLAYVVASVTFTLMISAIIIRHSWSAISALVFHLLTYLPFPLIFVLYYDMTFWPKLLSCLILNTGLALGLNIILDFERTAEGQSFANFDKPHFAGSHITLEDVWEMLLLSAIIHVLILVYFECKRDANDMASKYIDVEGRPVPWYYPIKLIIEWCKKKRGAQNVTNMMCELLSDVSVGDDAPREPTADKSTMTQISEAPLSLDVDVAAYQKYQRLRKPSKQEAPKSSSINSLVKPKREEFQLQGKFKSHSLEDMAQSSAYSMTSNRAQSFSTTITSGDTFLSDPPHSKSISSTSGSSYNLFLPVYSSFSEFPIENVELANVNEGISVINVSKSFEGIEYLSNISMTIHPREVTVILGKKRAGKMLLAEIIAGTVKMTSGQVVINGKNISDYKSEKDFDQPFAIMPKEEITFGDLTVRENLYFYTYVRGMRNHRQIAREIRKYVRKLDIPQLVDTLVNQLNYGMNRCLGFCCAMCGGSHNIVMDEPTLGLDEYGCHRMWDMIKAAACDRAIIVCTHRHEEAVILADRIAVLDWGRLQCYGPTQDLLNSFCNEYYLNCRKKRASKMDNTLAMMERYLPTGLQVRLDNPKQLNVRIRDGNERGLGLILTELENKKGSHSIESFTLYRRTLRDVFSQSYRNLQSLPVSTIADMLKFEPDKGKRRLLQFRSLFIQKLINVKRNAMLPLILIILFAIAIIAKISPQGTGFIHLPKRDISLCTYGMSVVLFKESNEVLANMTSHKLAAVYSDYVLSSLKYCDNTFFIVRGRRELIPRILLEQQVYFLHAETFYAAAIDIYPDKVISFWNAKLTHAAPISLNLLHNAILQFATHSKNATIRVANYPFKFTDSDFLNLKRLQTDAHLNMGTIPLLIFFAGVSMYAMHLIYEFSVGGMMLQLMSGVSHNLYWGIQIMWDMIIYNIGTIVIVAILVANDLTQTLKCAKQYNDVTILSIMVLLFEGFMIAVLPFIYSLSFLFKNMFLGYLVTFLILSGTSLLPTVTLPSIEQLLDRIMPNVVQYAVYWSPSAIFVEGMHRLHVLGAVKDCIKVVHEKENESYEAPRFFSLKYPGLLPTFIILLVLAIIYSFLFNKISQSIVFRTWMIKWHSPYGKNAVKPIKSHEIDPDVVLEGERTRLLSNKERSEKALIFEDLFCSKYLKGVTFGIKHREVFGIVGRYGSGKSKILEVTAGIGIIEGGDVYVYGKSVRYNPKEALKYLGYCSKQNALYEYMTVKELLHFYCRLSGRRTRETINLVEWLVSILGLSDNLDARIDNLEFASCRKVSLAVAVISSNQIIMIDEPTRGMDPEGCQQIWQMIDLIHKMGRTVVVAMESLEECLPLCDRLCILVNGRLQCIGSADYLIQKFLRGCVLQIFMQHTYESQLDLENTHLLSDIDSAYRMGENRSSQKSQTSNIVLVSESSEDYDVASNTRIHKFQGRPDQSQPTVQEEEVFDFWERRTRQYHDISEFIEIELPYARLEDQYSNMLIYYIPFRMLPLSQVFSIMEACKNSLNVSHYVVWRPSIIDMYEHFTTQHCRYWGKASSMPKLNQSTKQSSARLLALKRKSRLARIKRFFKRRMKRILYRT